MGQPEPDTELLAMDVDGVLIKHLKKNFDPFCHPLTGKLDTVIGQVTKSWHALSLAIAVLAASAVAEAPTGENHPVLEGGVKPLVSSQGMPKMSRSGIDDYLFRLASSDLPFQNLIRERLSSILKLAEIHKQEGVFWSPTVGIGPYFRWFLGLVAWRSATREPVHLNHSIDDYVHNRVDRGKKSPDDYSCLPYYDKVLPVLNDLLEGIHAEYLSQSSLLAEVFFSSSDAPVSYLWWLKTGSRLPATNFQFLRTVPFLITTRRKRFVDKLIESLVDTKSPLEPLLVIKSPNAPHGLTALATEIRDSIEERASTSNALPPVLYLSASRFDADSPHKSLGYYVAVISSWLKGEDLRGVAPLLDRDEISRRLITIRRAIWSRRIVIVIDGVQADRGAFGEIFDFIDDNPVSELLLSLLMPMTDFAQEMAPAWPHSIDELDKVASQEKMPSSIVILTTGAWTKFTKWIRFDEILPPHSPDQAPEIISAIGYRMELKDIIGEAVCPETECALIHSFLSLECPESDLTTFLLEVQDAISSPTAESMLGLYKSLRMQLHKKDPWLLVMLQLIAVCPGGLRLETLKRCLLMVKRSPVFEGTSLGWLSDHHWARKIVDLFPHLLVQGKDEILDIDLLPGRIEYLDFPSVASRTETLKATIAQQEMLRRISVDVRFLELRSLIVADLIKFDEWRWFLLNDVLAEESLRQWTVSIRPATQEFLSNIASSRRLVQAIWHGLNSRPFDGRQIDDAYKPKIEHYLPTKNDNERYLYITNFLLRRCLENHDEWLLGRGYSRHRLKVCLMLVANDPAQVRQHLSVMYQNNGSSNGNPIDAEEDAVPNTGDARHHHQFFENFRIATPVAYRKDTDYYLNGNTREKLLLDHLVTLGRAALDSGHLILARCAVINLAKRFRPSGLTKHIAQRGSTHTAAIKLRLDLLESDRKTGRAVTFLTAILLDLGCNPKDYEPVTVGTTTYPGRPIDLSRLKRDARNWADDWLEKNGDANVKILIALLLRLAEVRAIITDSSTVSQDPTGRRERFEGLLGAVRIFLFAEALRTEWIRRSPFGGDLSAKPARYLVRVVLILATLCGEASAESVHDRKAWRDAAIDMFRYARSSADIYARRYFRSERERAYMSILEASFASTWLVVLQTCGVPPEEGPRAEDSLVLAARHLENADKTLLRLGYPLTPTRRFLLEKIRLQRARIKSIRSNSALNGGRLDGKTLMLEVKEYDAAMQAFHALDAILHDDSEAPPTLWATLLSFERQALEELGPSMRLPSGRSSAKPEKRQTAKNRRPTR